MTQSKLSSRKRMSLSFSALARWFRSQAAQCVGVFLCAMLLLCVLLVIAVTPDRYSLAIGDISRVTINASKDVVDEITTERLREEAARQVEPKYEKAESVDAKIKQALNSILTQARAVQQYGRKLLEQFAPGDAYTQAKYSFATGELTYAHSLLTQLKLADFQLNTLLRTTDVKMDDMCENLVSAVNNTLNTNIVEGYEDNTIQYLQQIMGYKTDMNLLQNVVTPILRRVIEPNMIVDQEATDKLREEARAAVEPVIYKQGQNIVTANERVTATQLAMLRSLGLLDNDEIDMMTYVGGMLMVFISMMVLLTLLLLYSRGVLRSTKKLLILMFVLALTFGLCILSQLVNAYIAPVLLTVMMLTGLMGANAAVAGGITMAILVSTLIAGSDNTYGAEMVNLLFTSLISGAFAILLIQKKPNRQQVLLCGVLTALSNIVVILTIGFMTNTSIQEVFTNALWCAGGAMLASALCVIIDPILEGLFRLATPSKLLELSNPNHPLLRKLLIEASGTYHHSIIVANLAEAAAEAIGANPLLARTGAYFHDIGKLKRPLYFKENQMGDNPHDLTSPYISAAIVTAHTRDGVSMAQQYHLPQEIKDIVLEHHGDTPVMFFYHKAVQEANGKPVDIADFRYDGKRPHTKESAIVMLADTVEAAVRSMPDPTPQTIAEFISKLVHGKIDDGQLSEAPVTLQDISKICNAFATVLNGVFHERIEYPEVKLSDSARVATQRLPVARESAVEERELKKMEPDAQPQDEQADEAADEIEDEVARAAKPTESAKETSAEAEGEPREDQPQ